MKRRQFLQSSSTFLAGAGIAGMLPSEFLNLKKNIAAADKIRLGVIGIKGKIGRASCRERV